MRTDTARVSYTIPQAAEATGLSDRTIRRAIASGDLIAHFPTRKAVIRGADLDAWIEASPTSPDGAR
jgi:excisionase family DNA binding protein